MPGMEETAVRIVFQAFRASQALFIGTRRPQTGIPILDTVGLQCPEVKDLKKPKSKSPSPKGTPNPKASIYNTWRAPRP